MHNMKNILTFTEAFKYTVSIISLVLTQISYYEQMLHQKTYYAASV